MTRFRFPFALVAAVALGAATAACAAAPAPATAPAVATPSVVTVQLDTAVALMATQGFALAEAYRTGALNDGGEAVLSIVLAAGSTYMISAVCDQDCDDLDLELVDPSGEFVDSDYQLDDVPMVLTQEARGGRYSLTVSMASCEIEPCAYGVAVFRQQ